LAALEVFLQVLVSVRRVESPPTEVVAVGPSDVIRSAVPLRQYVCEPASVAALGADPAGHRSYPERPRLPLLSLRPAGRAPRVWGWGVARWRATGQ
jgi:hypothetical protein